MYYIYDIFYLKQIYYILYYVSQRKRFKCFTKYHILNIKKHIVNHVLYYISYLKL